MNQMIFLVGMMVVSITGCENILHLEDERGKIKVRLNSGYEPCKVKVRKEELHYQCKWRIK